MGRDIRDWCLDCGKGELECECDGGARLPSMQPEHAYSNARKHDLAIKRKALKPLLVERGLSENDAQEWIVALDCDDWSDTQQAADTTPTAVCAAFTAWFDAGWTNPSDVRDGVLICGGPEAANRALAVAGFASIAAFRATGADRGLIETLEAAQTMEQLAADERAALAAAVGTADEDDDLVYFVRRNLDTSLTVFARPRAQVIEATIGMGGMQRHLALLEAGAPAGSVLAFLEQEHQDGYTMQLRRIARSLLRD